jgi:hypothetical protein
VVAYADTSFLFSLYAQGAHTSRAGAMAGALKDPLAFTPLHRHELRNALRLAVFRGDMTAMQCRAVLANLETDVRSGVLVEVPVAWAEVFAHKERLA